MSKQRSFPRSRVITAAALVAALMALGASVAVMAPKADVKPDVVAPIAVEKLTEIERLAPLDTHQLILTPGLGQDNEWWSAITAFMPPVVRLDNLKPTADLGITRLGYSFSAADPARRGDQAYVRMLYVETDSLEHALKVGGWLSSSIGAKQGAYQSILIGHTVVLSTSDIPLDSTMLKSGGGLGDTAVYRQDTAQRDPGSLIWEDWGAYVKAAGASGGKPAEYSKFFYGVTGFVKGSRWVGYSASPQVGWSGEFKSGGMDSKLVSVTGANAAIYSYRKVLQRDPQGVPLASDGGAGNYLRDSFYVSHPDLKATMGSADLAFKPKAEGDTAFSFEPSSWLAGTSVSATARPEGLSLFAYSINGKQINLKVTVNEAITKARLADPTPVEPNAPPPALPPVYQRLPPQKGAVPPAR